MHVRPPPAQSRQDFSEPGPEQCIPQHWPHDEEKEIVIAHWRGRPRGHEHSGKTKNPDDPIEISVPTAEPALDREKRSRHYGGTGWYPQEVATHDAAS
jgi:hypothetical protein